MKALVIDLNIDLLKNKDYEIDKTLLNTKIDNYNFPSYIKMIEKMKDWIDNNIMYNYNKYYETKRTKRTSKQTIK